MSKRRLSNFEERLERLVEGSFARLFRGPLHPREVALKLARAIEDHTVTDDSGQEAAPTQYLIRVHPDDHRVLLDETADIISMLAEEVVNYCLQTGLHLTGKPEVLMVADAAIPAQSLQIDTRHIASKNQTTQIMPRVEIPNITTVDAQLIIDGKRTVQIAREIFNIGRHPDNDLVISDLRISRHHVQLRLRQGRYTLYDRQSRSGTYVNGQLISEHILSPGDVIRIGSVSLLYMEEEDQRDWNDTQLDMQAPTDPEGNLP